jgi:Cu2+-exporting ATPase
MESASEHVLARAFSAPTGQCFVPDEIVPMTGLGVEARLLGQRFRLGSAGFVAALLGVDELSIRRGEGDCGTCVYLANESGLLAVFTVEDELRVDAGPTIDALRAAGYQVVIASGDRASTVAAIAARLSISDWHAAMSPHDKLQFVRDRQARGETVIMIGDGINDAPVLAAADASIAVDAGTALARASADAIVVSSRLAAVVAAAEIAAQTRRTIRQNLIWAVSYNVSAVPLAATGMLAPWMAALGMSLSSLLVISNALRIQRHRISRAPASTAEAQAAVAELCT